MSSRSGARNNASLYVVYLRRFTTRRSLTSQLQIAPYPFGLLLIRSHFRALHHISISVETRHRLPFTFPSEHNLAGLHAKKRPFRLCRMRPLPLSYFCPLQHGIRRLFTIRIQQPQLRLSGLLNPHDTATPLVGTTPGETS